MRDIIFRGKRTDNGKWAEGGLISIDLETYSETEKAKYTHCIVEPNVEFYRGEIAAFEFVNPETVGQFTGLVDKHGDRKWEGDIFKFGDHLYIIEWDDDELAFWAFEPFEPDYSVPLVEFSADEIEVIGNVHDNPELIEREAQE